MKKSCEFLFENNVADVAASDSTSKKNKRTVRNIFVVIEQKYEPLKDNLKIKLVLKLNLEEKISAIDKRHAIDSDYRAPLKCLSINDGNKF